MTLTILKDLLPTGILEADPGPGKRAFCTGFKVRVGGAPQRRSDAGVLPRTASLRHFLKGIGPTT